MMGTRPDHTRIANFCVTQRRLLPPVLPRRSLIGTLSFNVRLKAEIAAVLLGVKIIILAIRHHVKGNPSWPHLLRHRSGCRFPARPAQGPLSCPAHR